MRKVNLGSLLQGEADEILTSRERGRAFHGTGDIRVAGDEVEIAVRRFVERRLPAAYGVGHGHIVDRKKVTSGQIDIVVHDAMTAALVARGADGTSYYPYESVLAIGEVKTSYRRSDDPIGAFSKDIVAIRDMDRERPGPQSALLRLGFGAGVTLPTGWPYRNPMFSFLVCLESEEFDQSEFARVASSVRLPDRPTIVCLLDRGVLVNLVRPDSGGVAIDWWPEFDVGGAHWELLTFDAAESAGLTLGVLYSGLGEHLSWAAVKAPDPKDYVPELRAHQLWSEQ
jgi:hypothetical protein